VRDAIRVQILQNINHLRDIKYLGLLGESGDVGSNKTSEIPTLAVLLNEVEHAVILEGVFQGHNAPVLDTGQ
jgi:hypothetical protein